MSEALSAGTARLSVVMSAHNEAGVIAKALESVQGIAQELVVVDSGSTDDTAAVASRFTDKIISEPNRLMLNVNKNVAIDAARGDWVLLLDPDEQVSPELADEIARVVSDPTARDGYWMPRRNHELGQWVAATYPDRQLRLFRNGKARFACANIHEMVEVQGHTGELAGDLLHFPPQGLFEYVHKRNLYSEHRAALMFAEGRPFRAHRLVTGPARHFVKHYLLKRGFREGVPGFLMAAIGAFGIFLHEAKLWQKTTDGKSIAPTGRFESQSAGGPE